MSLVTVVALRDFEHDGQMIHRGEAVTIDAGLAAGYGRSRKVSLSPHSRPTYQTRQMEAAQPVVPVAIVVPVVEPEPVPVKRRGRRRR